MINNHIPTVNPNGKIAGAATVLVVDDDLVSTMVLETILRKEGFIVLTAESGEECRDIAIRDTPDLILLDINMPGEDGLTTCRVLKSQAATDSIPVVFISAKDDVNSKVEGFNVGGVDYVTKPFYPAEVLARVRLHLRMGQAYKSMVSMHLAQIYALADAQQMLMPQPGEYPDAHFAAIYRPKLMAGGDFYDVFPVGRGKYEYYVADISGHDLGTSLATSALKVLIRQNAQLLYPPLDNLSLVNHHIRTALKESQFITLLYAQLNQSNHKLTLINAGNPAPILVQKNSPARAVPITGDFLGVFDTYTVEPYEINVSQGDRVYMFSDGIIEQDKYGPVSRRKGLANLIEQCETYRTLPLEDAVKAIADSVLPERDQLGDDVVLLAVEI